MLSNIGLAFNVHYCGGEIASVSTVYFMDDSCAMPVAKDQKCCKSSDVKSDCCKSKVVHLHDKTDTVIVKTFSFNIDHLFRFDEWESLTALGYVPLQTTELQYYYCDANAPPLFKLYCQYTLYA